MKIFLSIVLVSALIYLGGCKDEGFNAPTLTYSYIQHTAFTVNTSQWTPNDHHIKYTVTMQNIGNETATNIRTQVLYKKPSAVERATNYLMWLNPDSSKIEIPAGGSITLELSDTVGYIDSVTYWNLSYNGNTHKNAP